MSSNLTGILSLILLALPFSPFGASAANAADPFQIATFSVDITVPIGHRSMAIIPRKVERLVDPLYARGMVILSDQKPIVILALDYCEVRNGAYDDWRSAIALAAKTTPTRVLLSSLHQHDAPVTDTGAEALLESVGLGGEMCDVAFHRRTVQRVATAVKESLKKTTPVTHLGMGKAKVHEVASTRRVVHPDGRIDYSRGSGSGGDAFYAATDEGEIDPWLRTISFWNDKQPVAAISAYAVHPMSYYGRGDISADFVGMARKQRQDDNPAIHQIYVSGCSGDVTAGKYNDGAQARRKELADKLYQGMVDAWDNTETMALQQIDFRSRQLDLDFHEGDAFTVKALTAILKDKEEPIRERILAAMGLSSLQRIDAGQPIDLPCIDFGPAQIVLFPGEAFVGYQHIAQQMRPDSFVMPIGYGECWPGYIPTKQAFDEDFGHSWRWVAAGSEAKIRPALQTVLATDQNKTDRP
ncbi:hypothetical protein FF011L_31360 [Roseimaritima multifibrata]|uniref:Neutral/alkaline non-lysosomal ceramidase n=1 Tax=Roseimaritima multifibrata TaxID=1930274 RepID=A0A517MHS8_9BACT|nr:hypothetical protein [Roseimaritima multifibrata]QDS94357.1 hypothetical protein FF011L_31360 [Roseimaritima multifibrata]